ncbi:MAG TPA: GntR family transcriptional regulator [Acidimicrobiales bacterium]|nr:GntR family transcriptional regulator [Acidimicrobiales bacterium]
MEPRRPLRQKTGAFVVDYILEQLFSGALRSGDRIDHDHLEEVLGVSRLPVREALVMLERDGIVSSRYHRGVFVEPFDADSILDDFEIMGLLSGLAVRRLAEKNDRETIAVLRSLLDRLRATEATDRDGIFKVVSEIMTTEHRAGGSRRLRAQLRAHAGFLPQAFQYIDRGHAATVDAHAQVLDAVVAGDGETAARLRLEDFRDAGRAVVGELRRRGVIAG